MKRQYWIALAVGLILVMTSIVVVFAVNGPVVDWWVLASGGALSSANGITMNSTLGQPVVGQSSSGNVSLSAGYWAAGGEYLIYLPLVNH